MSTSILKEACPKRLEQENATAKACTTLNYSWQRSEKIQVLSI